VRKCYGVDLEKEVTPLMARDAIVACFTQAHKEVLKDMESYANPGQSEEMKQLSVRLLIENAFAEVGGDFEHPTTESLYKVVEVLKEYAAKFRNPKLIEKHAEAIFQILERLSTTN
jgi:hypothetical protein